MKNVGKLRFVFHQTTQKVTKPIFTWHRSLTTKSIESTEENLRWTRRKKEALIRGDFEKLKKLAKWATPFHALRLALLAQDKRTSAFYTEEQAWPASRGAPARNLFESWGILPGFSPNL